MPRRTGRQNRLTSQVGEYLVVAELARRGLIATTFAGNVPEYDVIATDERGKHVAIQVKATRSQGWQFDISRFCKVTIRGRRQILGRSYRSPIHNLIVILVHLATTQKSRDRFYILPWSALRDLLVSGHREWLRAHNGIRPNNPESTHSALHFNRVEAFANKWRNVNEFLH